MRRSDRKRDDAFYAAVGIVPLVIWVVVMLVFGAVIRGCLSSVMAAPLSTQVHGTFQQHEVYAARMCVNESGFQEGALDCLALLNLFKRNARYHHMSVGAYLLRHHADAVVPGRRYHGRGRMYIVELAPHGNQPTHWPSNLDWNTSRDRWMQYLRWAATVLRSPVATLDPCAESPHIWGSPVYDRVRIQRMVRAGTAHVVDCGNTANVFLRFGR